MKNKIKIALLGLLTFMVLPFNVNAATSGTLNVNCGTGKVTVNKTITCKVTTSVSGGSLVSLEFDIDNNDGISIEGFTFASGWNNQSYKNNHVAVVGSAKGGTVDIGTITVKGVTEGTSSITLKKALAGDDSWNEFDISNKTVNITVEKVTTKPTTKPTSSTKKSTTTRKTTTSKATTTKPVVRTTTTTKKTTTTTRVTIAPTQSTTQAPILTTSSSTTTTRYTDNGSNQTTLPRPTNGSTNELRTSIHYYTNEAGKIIYSEAFIRTDNYYNELAGRKTKPFEQHVLGVKAVFVDDYRVVYKDGKYYVTVDPKDEEVEIIIETTEPAVVVGTGTRGLGVGKNVVDIYMKSERDERTFQIIINRPDGLNVGSTELSSLKIVDYELEFQPNIYNYEVTVPYTTKELYVIAKHVSEYATIGGDGLFSLMDDEDQKIYVHVSYGKLQETEYVITVKKSYTMLILWIVIGLLGLGLVAMALYAYTNRKNAVSKVTAEKDAIIASGNRAVTQEVAKDAKIAGEKLGGLTRQTVKPTLVENAEPQAAPTQSALDRVPNRVAMPVKPTPVQPAAPVQMSTAAPQPQVRVIKRGEQPEIKISNPSSPYQQDSEIVIKEL